MIRNYTGLSFEEIQDLPVSLFLLYKKEATIDKYYKNEKGREFLEDLWRYNQTSPDTEAIHDFQAKGGM